MALDNKHIYSPDGGWVRRGCFPAGDCVAFRLEAHQMTCRDYISDEQEGKCKYKWRNSSMQVGMLKYKSEGTLGYMIYTV